MELRALILTLAFGNVINEPDIEAGAARTAKLTGRDLDFDAFCDAISECIRDGLIRDPVRLPGGSLQCHWHLELTPEGVAAVRDMPGVDLCRQGIGTGYSLHADNAAEREHAENWHG